MLAILSWLQYVNPQMAAKATGSIEQALKVGSPSE